MSVANDPLAEPNPQRSNQVIFAEITNQPHASPREPSQRPLDSTPSW
jgi:hypothetical protein